MQSQGRVNFIHFVIFIAALLNECSACFLSNENERVTKTTGEAFYEECQCTEPGYTVKDLIWLGVDNLPIWGPGTNNMIFTEEQGDSINLHIPSITRSMSGLYKCVTQVNGVTYVKSYTIDAYEPLIFYKTPADQHLVEGEDDTIVCAARSETTPIMSWKKEISGEFVDILYGDGKYENIADGLMIKNVSKEDAGKYKCTALVISTGEDADKFIDVNIYTVPVIEELQANPGAVVVAGEPLSIDCIAGGMPFPLFAWSRKDLSSGNITQSWQQKVNTIFFDRTYPDDEGIYECHAFNEAGSHKKLIKIEVLVEPEITYFPNITEKEGTQVQITCNATGRSKPDILITYEGKELSNELKLLDYADVPNMVKIKLERLHEGIYVCNATNEVNSTESAMYLTVLHQPYFEHDEETVWGYEGKTVNLRCAPESNPPSNVTWRFESNNIPNEEQVEINKSLIDLLNDMPEQYINFIIDNSTTYGMYVCTAKNELGEATTKIHLKEGFRPPSVTYATTIEIKATTVTFEIEEPIVKDIPEVLGFIAQYDEAANYNVTLIHLNRTWSIDRPYKIEKLKPNTKYIVSFAAVNEVGAGELSNSITFETMDTSIPESPVLEEESLQRSTGGNFVLKWREPDDNGEPIDYYVLKYCPVFEEQFDELCEVRQASTTELQLTDLESNTTYLLELVAHSAEGNSTPASIYITIPDLSELEESATYLSAGVIIGISVLIVIVCLVLLDLLLLAWRRQGIIAACCIKKDKKKKEDALNSRDKKGLLNGESTERRSDGHKEYEYNKNTGVITGKHSSV